MADDHPIKLCECGCGRPTSIATRNQRARGIVKGQPHRFVKGHRPQNALSYRRQRYVQRGTGKATKYFHRQRAEAAIGHPLPPKAEIHHVDEDPWNPNARLVICPSHLYHRLLHVRTRVLRAGGNPNTDKYCPACRTAKPLTAFVRTNWKGAQVPSDEYGAYCRDCKNQRQRQRWAKHKDEYNAQRRAKCAAELVSVIDSDADETDTNTL